MKFRNAGRNYILNGDGFYISYNPATDTASPEMILCELFARIAGMPHQAETSLCADGKFYILFGDWREEYEALAPQGLDACMLFYKQMAEHISPWSDPLPPDHLSA